jgi:ectoine hydroxylase-related dioxygenase (phytanoyl-CoA dioxygenase family)
VIKNLSKKYNDNGYLIVKNFLHNDKKFKYLSQQLNNDVHNKLSKININKYGGSLIGNLNVYPGIFGKKIFNVLKIKGLNKIVKECTGKELNNFDISYGGNLNLPKKYNQHFHTDGKFEEKMIIISVATSDVNLNSGPTEIILKSHKKKITYLEFLISKKNKKKLTLSFGDLLIRQHYLWHRGTVNYSNKARFQIAFMLFERKRKIKQKIKLKKLYFFNNFFGNTFLSRLKEFIYVYLRPMYIIYKILNIKNY